MLQSTALELENSQARECCPAGALPLTLELAGALSRVISPAITSMPMWWPFNDRVVAWLLPGLRDDVDRFHRNSGPTMVEIFPTHQLERIDRSLVPILANRAERLSPGTIRFLRHLAGADAPASAIMKTINPSYAANRQWLWKVADRLYVALDEGQPSNQVEFLLGQMHRIASMPVKNDPRKRESNI